jgi:hypothetical protein
MLLKFLVFCLIAYIIFRVLSFILRLGRVVSTQKQTFQNMQNHARQAQREAQRRKVNDDVYIDHMPPKSKASSANKSGGYDAGEYVDYEEVKE